MVRAFGPTLNVAQPALASERLRVLRSKERARTQGSEEAHVTANSLVLCSPCRKVVDQLASVTREAGVHAAGDRGPAAACRVDNPRRLDKVQPRGDFVSVSHLPGAAQCLGGLPVTR